MKKEVAVVPARFSEKISPPIYVRSFQTHNFFFWSSSTVSFFLFFSVVKYLRLDRAAEVRLREIGDENLRKTLSDYRIRDLMKGKSSWNPSSLVMKVCRIYAGPAKLYNGSSGGGGVDRNYTRNEYGSSRNVAAERSRRSPVRGPPGSRRSPTPLRKNRGNTTATINGERPSPTPLRQKSRKRRSVSSPRARPRVGSKSSKSSSRGRGSRSVSSFSSEASSKLNRKSQRDKKLFEKISENKKNEKSPDNNKKTTDILRSKSRSPAKEAATPEAPAVSVQEPTKTTLQTSGEDGKKSARSRSRSSYSSSYSSYTSSSYTSSSDSSRSRSKNSRK